MGRPTLEDVARLAGVSRSTVSRVINRQPGVAPPHRRLVQEAIAELGYRPHLGARALASGRADAVDLVIVDEDPAALSADPHYARVIAGTVNALVGKKDVRLQIRLTSEATDLRGGLGAVLVNVRPELASQLRHRYGWIVSMGRSAPRVSSIEPDNADGGRLAVDHLYRAGRRRIAVIGGPESNPCAVERREGGLRAIREAGLEPLLGNGDFTAATAERVTRRLVAEHPDLDAVFASCDLTAAGALRALASMGRRVPDDVAVVSFDDGVIAASLGLTSVRQTVEENAATATRMVLARECRRVMVPVSLTVRQSGGQHGDA
ncbi:LacI family DNA-binding transcriptional regulator [Kutzneria buriramensis]|uniref:DNA-binding LacI/PurR family transcriptional regulator n=1 Tax=Kutzneria buriramensis TaxID=1045776 RepID=A0A3E0I582_9PSEU|nr:LacI family DNA-binding transcriptional regulator [Kutzneria buriramensis]REH53787.1 DNA-binding LacI/PurR family transcriptional regulator [Kutzneria buriramensis]